MVHMLLAIIYLAFISLGLPDSLLGSAWPSMHQDFSVPVSYAGGISMIIAASTILSSLQCDRLTRKIGTGRVTTISVFLTAAAFASLFYIGITAGRALSGFLAAKLTDTQMIRIGQVLILCGVIMVLVPNGEISALCGLVCIGFGCAPVFPSIIHATPAHFGAGKSQALIGVQMAASYAGTCIMPPVFGLFANHIGAYLFPWYLLLVLALMILMHEKLLQKTKDTIKT